MKGQRFFAVACASAMLLVSASAFAQLSDDERKCSDAFNKAARNVANQEQKNNRKACVKDGGGEACVAATGQKATDKLVKLNELFLSGGKCDPVPVFGVDQAGANSAITLGSDTIIRDIFGDPVSGVTAGDKCQDAVAKRSGKIYDTILKAFRKCAKDAAAIGNIGVLEACVGTAAGDAKVGTFAGKLLNDINNKCAASPPIVAGTEDGECSSAGTAADFADCAVERTKCQACQALNDATGGSADCATISGDPTCGGTAIPHKCTFDGATDNSSLQICFLGVCPAPIDISGAVDLTCDPATQDVNGKRDCSVELQTFDPFVLSGVGTICIDPATGPCPDGEIDCDGGNAMNLEVEADHQIGACTGNADCASQCGTYCSGIGKAVYISGCESFCQGGTNANNACECDTLGAATCAPASTLDCPGGSCEGKDNEADADCHCTCVDDAVAPAGGAGAARFRLGIAIRVEADAVCDNVQVLVRLPQQCAPFTTETATVVQHQANEGVGDQGPYSEVGVAGNCAAFDASTTTAFEFVSTLAFMDSTIGDLQSRLNVDCQ